MCRSCSVVCNFYVVICKLLFVFFVFCYGVVSLLTTYGFEYSLLWYLSLPFGRVKLWKITTGRPIWLVLHQDRHFANKRFFSEKPIPVWFKPLKVLLDMSMVGKMASSLENIQHLILYNDSRVCVSLSMTSVVLKYVKYYLKVYTIISIWEFE